MSSSPANAFDAAMKLGAAMALAGSIEDVARGMVSNDLDALIQTLRDFAALAPDRYPEQYVSDPYVFSRKLRALELAVALREHGKQLLVAEARETLRKFCPAAASSPPP